eukprot:7912532-Heterocapsa_arctica.AAC.1
MRSGVGKSTGRTEGAKYTRSPSLEISTHTLNCVAKRLLLDPQVLGAIKIVQDVLLSREGGHALVGAQVGDPGIGSNLASRRGFWPFSLRLSRATLCRAMLRGRRRCSRLRGSGAVVVVVSCGVVA